MASGKYFAALKTRTKRHVAGLRLKRRFDFSTHKRESDQGLSISCRCGWCGCVCACARSRSYVHFLQAFSRSLVAFLPLGADLSFSPIDAHRRLLPGAAPALLAGEAAFNQPPSLSPNPSPLPSPLPLPLLLDAPPSSSSPPPPPPSLLPSSFPPSLSPLNRPPALTYRPPAHIHARPP